MTESPDFVTLPDLASRSLGGGVPYANDELFAERENLIKPGPAVFSTEGFGHKGKVYDGWETRRRREPGHDFAVVRLGAPGIVRGVVIDTA
ncbi:MAG: allantoicase, partial [Pseudonocardiales bacterium]|nr:allantoicase [Pseudonocardiales bacterium]